MNVGCVPKKVMFNAAHVNEVILINTPPLRGGGRCPHAREGGAAVEGSCSCEDIYIFGVAGEGCVCADVDSCYDRGSRFRLKSFLNDGAP